jgi:hypothetical protein
MQSQIIYKAAKIIFHEKLDMFATTALQSIELLRFTKDFIRKL